MYFSFSEHAQLLGLILAIIVVDGIIVVVEVADILWNGKWACM